MLVEATVKALFEATELIDFGVTETLPNVQPQHGIQGVNLQKTYNSGSEPEGIDIWSGLITLSTGTLVLDLTNLPYPSERGATDFTGERVVALIAYAPGNTQPIRIEGGDANPYELFGDVDTEIQVYPNMVELRYQLAGPTGALAAVAAGVKDVKFTGTGSEVLRMALIVGGTP